MGFCSTIRNMNDWKEKANSAHGVLVYKKAEDMEREEMMIPGQANGAQGGWDANGTHHG
jgi:hypothetical protein